MSCQLSNFDGTLSHHAAWPGPPGISLMSLSRNDSSTAFFSHLIDVPRPVGRLLGDARFAAVEQIERLLDRLAHRALGRWPDRVALFEGGVDGLGEIVVGPG